MIAIAYKAMQISKIASKEVGSLDYNQVPLWIVSFRRNYGLGASVCVLILYTPVAAAAKHTLKKRLTLGLTAC